MPEPTTDYLDTDPSETVAATLGPFLGAASGVISIAGLIGNWAGDQWLWAVLLIIFMTGAGIFLHPKWVALKKTPDWLAAASAAIYLPPTIGLVIITGGIDSPFWLLFLVGSISAGFSGQAIATKYVLLGAAAAFAAMFGSILLSGQVSVQIIALVAMRLTAIITVGFIAYRSVVEIENILIKRAETMRLKLEAELRIELVEKQTETLRSAHDKLARATRQKDEFLANMSHELRTPLNSILGVSEALMAHVYGPMSDAQSSSLKVVERSGQHLLELINNLLDVSKMEAGKFEIESSDARVSDIMTESVQLLEITALQRELTVDVPPIDPELQLRCDALRIRQVILNLLGNAIKFTPPGGTVGIEVDFRQVAPANELSLTVWDTGIGISKNEHKTLFDAFVQVTTDLKVKNTGTGLGLTLVAKIVDLHGGRVEIESEPDKGSRFTIFLPNASKVKPAVPRFLENTQGSVAIESNHNTDFDSNSNAPLILLADDEPNNIPHVRDYLSSLGYRVEIAKNGVETLEKVKANRPALILLDMQMPKMNGFEFLEHMQNDADADIQNIPIIAVTALASAGDEQRCLSAGACGYLAKPFRLTHLMRVVRKHIKDEPQEE
jgi:signal transduction histidine kinase/ActR/RegA family two-component response regulator